MRYLVGFMCVLALGVVGCGETAGTGGSGGSAGNGGAGSGGEGGTAGMAGAACEPDELACESAEGIDPIEEMCEIILPDQPSACDGTESIKNPTSCTASGNTVIHKLTKMQIAGDCNTGYDLDSCDGDSCLVGYYSFPSADGANGVDNGLVWAERLFSDLDVEAGLGPLDQAFHNAICTGGVDIEIEVDAVPEDSCSVVTVTVSGVSGDPIPMNLSDDGCLSGALGTIPISLGDVQGRIENAVVRMTVSDMGFSDGILGGTVTGATLEAMSEEIEEGFSAAVGMILDINADLSGDLQRSCDSLSMTLEIGGVKDGAGTGGTGGSAGNGGGGDAMP